MQEEYSRPRRFVGIGRKVSLLLGDRSAAQSFYERARVVSEADRDTKGAAETRALIAALGDKPGIRQSIPATSDSHAGQ